MFSTKLTTAAIAICLAVNVLLATQISAAIPKIFKKNGYEINDLLSFSSANQGLTKYGISLTMSFTSSDGLLRAKANYGSMAVMVLCGSNGENQPKDQVFQIYKKIYKTTVKSIMLSYSSQYLLRPKSSFSLKDGICYVVPSECKTTLKQHLLKPTNDTPEKKRTYARQLLEDICRGR
ncbi:hypothetical protein BDF19DRAFT_442166 [Syncephalis fuscata]|nr:hypothetical protein BDF19DRAFT_442166 [Syncephalis fuscata]